MTNPEALTLLNEIAAAFTRDWKPEFIGVWLRDLVQLDHGIGQRAVTKLCQSDDWPKLSRLHAYVREQEPRYQRPEFDATVVKEPALPAEKIKALLAKRCDWDAALEKLAVMLPPLERAFPHVHWSAFTTSDMKHNYLDILAMFEGLVQLRRCRKLCPADPRECLGQYDGQRSGKHRNRASLIPTSVFVDKHADGTLRLRITWCPCPKRVIHFTPWAEKENITSWPRIVAGSRHNAQNQREDS